MANDTTAASRVVSIDLDDDDLLQGLWEDIHRIAVDWCGGLGSCEYPDQLHGGLLDAALEVLLPRPKPEEPTGLGAVVRDGDEVWVLADAPDASPWIRAGRVTGDDWDSWSRFSDAVEILFHGVEL